MTAGDKVRVTILIVFWGWLASLIWEVVTR